MMTKYNKRKSKKLLALLFAGFMLSATTASFAACSKTVATDDNASEVTVEKSDDSRISNGSFEFFNDNDGKNLIVTSPTGWTRSAGSSSSGTALSSSSKSGIVDTKNWETFTKTSGKAPSTLEEATANWSELTVRDQLKFIKEWEDKDSKNKAEDLSFYDKDASPFKYNVSFEDLPDCENPETHLGESAGEDTSLLMIHNKRDDKWGTAQKYTSSSTVTLQPGLTAKFSVWVKTAELTYANTAGESQDVVKDRGAYIGVTNTVAGKTLDEVQIKNIKADDWKEYTFYLTASDYAETTFTIVLGLGQGGGNKWEYVSGYAFFDDVTCTVRQTADLKAEATAAVGQLKASDKAEDKILRADGSARDVNALHIDLGHASYPFSWTDSDFDKAQTTEVKNGETFSSGITDSDNVDIVGYFKNSELKTKAGSNENAYFTAAYNKDFEKYPFADDSSVLLLFSATGAPYTAKENTDTVVLAGNSDERYAVSFWLKTSDLTGGFTGAGVTLITEYAGGNVEETELFASQNTLSPTKIDADDENGEKVEDIYDGWQRYFVFLENNLDDVVTVRFRFTYGPTAIATTAKTGYRDGYAAFANFQTYILTEDEFGALSDGRYSKVVSFGEEDTTFSSFDSAAGVPTDAIENGFANPTNYDGVNGGSKYVVWNGADCEKNAYEYAGLLNEEYLANYTDILPAGATVDLTAALTGATQPLLIYNNEAMAYGYIGSTKTIEANSYATVAVKMKASAGAIANVYLMEKTDSGYTDSLTVQTPNYTYWYDKDGNICKSDPTKDGFDKKRDVAFKRNARGLYEANPLWSGYAEAEMKGKLFANLQNYEVDPETGDLLVANGGVTYNYDSSVFQHAGNNGVAFYAKDNNGVKEYYATEAKTDRVYDLASLANVKDFARYTDNAKTGVLSMRVAGSENAEWVECFFYIHTGDEAKSYRLEVWSGARDGSEKSAADTFVAFEQISWSADETSFGNLKKEKLDEAREAYKATLGEGERYTEDGFRAYYDKLAYSAFSFFDSAKFLRYDETLDKEKVGNSYDDYDSTTYGEGLVYFLFEDARGVSVFADFSYNDVTVAADVDEDDDHDHDHDHDETTTDGMNVWLLASSLVMAGALLLAVVSLIVRNILKKYGKTHVRVRKAPKAKKEKAEKKETAEVLPEEPKDENDPYND